MNAVPRDSDWIETIVAEVVRRLLAKGIGVSAVDVTGKCDLQLDDSVVALATLSGRLDGVSRLVVKTDAVVTPSVRDELRQRNIALVRHPAGVAEIPH
ncbi:MAG: hypothetical protein CMJ59_18935 [Planctomycetaceae bacterium]|nr:hypothetical protein [Planctomycetaceae bacterium]